MNINQSVIYISFLLFLSGCVAFPAPHTRQVIPEISGQVTLNKQPISGATVNLYKEKKVNQCDDTKYRVDTDKNGQFRYKGKKDIRLFYQFGDPIETWGLCIIYSGKHYNGWTAHDIGYVPSIIVVNCELSDRNNENDDGYLAEGVGICKITIRM